MKDRIDDKIEEIEKYLDELLDITPESFEKYFSDLKTKAACERYFEKIVEALVDLAFLTIKQKQMNIPEDEESSFIILADKKIISDKLAKKLINAKGMRNIIVHEYGKIDDELVFQAVSEELENDVREFIKKIEEVI